jgi:asparagine synthase (glutamine-hydrolysing)
MCGICGQVRWDARGPSEALIESMCEAQRHRGPDSRGVHIDGSAGLGIQRLRVIDLDTGDQPIFNEDRSIVVVLNGEIYNFRELRAQLERSGHRFATRSDTEVIAHLYEQEGSRCVRSLQGMFALAIWDTRRRRLLLARDRVGKKPLFYSLRDGALSFASELPALLRDPEISRTLDPSALDAYFALRWIPAPHCAFAAVRKLPPASILILEEGKAKVERYWELDYSRAPSSEDEREVASQLREELRAAVRRRMISDVPLGAFLSGGIDSSGVVGAMAEESSGPVRTFSIGFTSERHNELDRARLVAERFDTDHEELVVTPDAVEILPRIVRHYGEPFADSSAIPSFYLAEMAKRQVTVVLNGDGGDESFAGYSRYLANLALDRAARLPRSLRLSLQALDRTLPPSGQIDSNRSRLQRFARATALSAPQRHASYLIQQSTRDRRDLYTSEFREQVGEADLAAAAIEERWATSTASNMLDRMLDVDVGLYLPDDLLTKMDIATMAYSLEARSPLLDTELMEFAATLPPQLKARGGQKKIALRAALRGWIPDEILDGRKQGFTVPMAEWLRGDLKDLAYDTLLDSTAVDRAYFEPEVVRGLLDRHAAGQEDRSQTIWSLLMFELWQREIAPPGARESSSGAILLQSGHTPSHKGQKSSEGKSVDEGGVRRGIKKDRSMREAKTSLGVTAGEGRDGDAHRSSSEPDERRLDQVGVFEAMRWYWGLVVIPVVLLVGLAVALAFIRPPVYTATTSLSIDFGAESPSSLPGSVSAAQALSDSYARAIQATSVVDEIARRTGYSPEEIPDHVSASPIPDSTIVRVTGTADSGEAATSVANIAGTSLVRYIGALNGSRTGSQPVLAQFRRAEVLYQNRLDHQLELADAAAAEPADEAVQLELKRARVQTQVALLQKQSLASVYGTSQQAYVAPLTFLNRATSSSSDRIAKLEFFVFVGLIAGLAIGAALATARANRF